MKKSFLPFLFLFIISSQSFAQKEIDSLSALRIKFESFKYKEVINDADNLLLHKNNFNADQLIDIYRLKGISEYSLLDDSSAEQSFTNILKINSSYKLDSAKTSPKIITFYNEVREKFISELIKSNQLGKSKPNTLTNTKSGSANGEFDIKPIIIRSIILPGWGQLYNNENLKGWILTSLSAAAIFSSIYFIIDSNNKQTKYLNDINPLTIQNNYNKYNTSYKLRNASIISFAAVWIYSQIDALFFSKSNAKPILSLRSNSLNQYQLNISLSF